MLTEALSSAVSFSDLPVKSLSDLTLEVIKNSSYKMTAGEIIKAVQSLRPTAKSSSISRYITRWVRRGIVAKTDTSHNSQYWYNPPEKKIQTTEEFKIFWDPDKTLYVHGLLIIIEGATIHQKEEFYESFLDYPEQIRFECTPGKKIRIDFSCADWKKSLDYEKFSYFIDKVETVLRLKGYSYKEMYIRNCHFNQDNEKYELDGSNRIKVQAFKNAWLNIYNKKEGIRAELQLTKMKIPVHDARKLLQKEAEALRIGDVFHKAMLVYRKNLIVAEIIKNHVKDSKINHVYLGNVIQQLDETVGKYQKYMDLVVKNQDLMINNQMQLATLGYTIANNQRTIVEGHDVTQEMLMDHDAYVEKRFNETQDQIELQQERIMSNIPSRHEPYSIKDKILHYLSIKNRTIYELAELLQIDYKNIYYHVQKLIQAKEIKYLKEGEERGRRGAKRKLLTIIEGDDKSNESGK
ncbi:MAG: hypothetical protein ACTSQE_10835 [Candidatus Heimdallarchaeaceae archaeon]